MSHYNADDAPGFAQPKIALTGNFDAQRYQIRAPGRIARLLREMHKAASLITVYYGPDNRYLLSSLLAVEPDARRLVLSGTANAETNQQLGSVRQLICVSSHHRVPTQWQSESLKLIDFEGEPAIQTAFPQSLLHLQRREYHRLTTPVSQPARCRLSWEDKPASSSPDQETETKTVTVTVVDISCGGIGILDHEEELVLTPGRRYHDCLLDLGEFGEIQVDIEIRNTYAVTLTNGNPARRAGCAFLNLPPRINAILQRYIHALDMKRHGHLDGSLHQ